MSEMSHIYADADFGQAVAAIIRAEAALRRVRQREIATAIGVTSGTLSKKWAGVSPWTLDELFLASGVIGVPTHRLIELAEDMAKAPTVAGASYAARDSNPEPAD